MRIEPNMETCASVAASAYQEELLGVFIVEEVDERSHLVLVLVEVLL